jgi:hypothetical protein
MPPLHLSEYEPENADWRRDGRAGPPRTLETVAVAQKAACRDVFAPGVDGGYRVVRRERRHLVAPVCEKCITTDDQRGDPLLRSGRECLLDLGFIACA